MKRVLLTLQILAGCSLAAAGNSPGKAGCCKKDCAKEITPNLCPCCQRGDAPLRSMPKTCCDPEAYNHPANINVDQCVDLYADISYLYYYINQEGTSLATTCFLDSDVIYPPSTAGFAIFPDFNYTSGFKIGIGSNLNVDDWVLDLQYTYLRQNIDTNSGSAPSGERFNLMGWFYQQIYAEGIVAQSFDSKWKFGLDWLDLTFSRPYYQGRRLTITPSAGLRASWIRENLNISSSNAFWSYEDEGPEFDSSHNHSHSWAIGPRALLNAHWLAYKGFRFQGNMGGSLLFTQYTKVTHRESGIPSAGQPTPINFQLSNYNCLRAMVEGNLGIGWGQYIYQNRFHIDLSATYDFNYLWHQNMMKYIAEIMTPGFGGSLDDLVMHGLNITGRFDF